MIRLQCFALLVLAGLTQVYSVDIEKGYEFNSFPYYHIPNDPTQDDLYTSSIVSVMSGPICSGFHIKQNLVITAASCVHRETADSLIVISHNLIGKNKSAVVPPLSFLRVKKVLSSPDYRPATMEHNLAVLQVELPKTEVAMLTPPPMDYLASSKDPDSTVFMTKYSYEDKLDVHKFYTKSYPVQAVWNVELCTNRSINALSFYCVYLTSERPYSYGENDIGTPLYYKFAKADMVEGMFTGSSFDVPQSKYLYQNLMEAANLGFLHEAIKTLGGGAPAPK